MDVRAISMAGAVAAGILVIAPAPAGAQSNIAAAARAFSMGQQAELAGDYRGASEHYELADRTVPSPEALRSAAKSRLKAGDEAMAATHAEALARRYSDERSRKLAGEMLQVLRPKLARVSLTCTPACGAVADGGAISVDEAANHIFYLEPGRHTIGAGFGSGDTQQQVVEGIAGQTITLDMVAPPRAPSPAVALTGAQSSAARDVHRSSGLPRGWFITSASITVVLAGASLWSGLDTLDHKNAYEQDPTQAALEDGQRRELRTNILLGATAAAAITTGLIASFTRWSSEEERPASTVAIAPAVGGAVVVFEGGFP